MIYSPYVKVHQSPKGPGDARPTALQVVKDQNLGSSLEDKVMLITGGTGGLGFETARALFAAGAKVYITGRDMERATEAARKLNEHPKIPVEVIKMELDSFDSIKAGAQDFLRRSKSLNVLVCNAGVMACPEMRTRDGHEYQFGTNHLGHFLLFQLLKDRLLESTSTAFASRVISVSSCAHRGGVIHFGNYNLDRGDDTYDPWKAYSQSKTANIYFANEIERRHQGHGLHGLSPHPGFIATDLLRHVADDPMAKEVIKDPEGKPYWKSVEQGASTATWAAVGKELEGTGGIYLDDVQEAKPYDAKDPAMFGPGYGPHAFDEEAAKQLWLDSLEMTGLKE